MQLEIKHLAPYLPYGLKFAHIDHRFKGGCEVYLLEGLTYGNRYKKEDLRKDQMHLLDVKEITFWTKDFGLNSTAHVVKPLLLPLSKLTEEIEHNGEKFVPIEFIEEKYYTQNWVSQLNNCIEDERWIWHLDYSLIDYLFQWHFDVFGLIHKGLAIDKTTIQ